ncbi:MAG: hypothetical protein GY898_16760 [Proteobacteria bacterium]|nr:hypothetical protein [Pseudomonadota bacterium]
MTRIFAALFAASVLSIAPASVFACAMEPMVDLPEIKTDVKDNAAQLAALMGEIDDILLDKVEALKPDDSAKADAAATKSDATAKTDEAPAKVTKKSDTDS